MVGQGSGETGGLGDGSAMDEMLRMGFDKETAEKALKVVMQQQPEQHHGSSSTCGSTGPPI
jgi:hypothetical protein